jgi:hypothetical protein
MTAPVQTSTQLYSGENIHHSISSFTRTTAPQTLLIYPTLAAVIGYETVLNIKTQELHINPSNTSAYLNYSAGYRPYDAYMCDRFGEDCYNYYYSLGKSYGPSYAPEFANSYTFPIYFSNFAVEGSDNAQQTDPAIMKLTYSVQMGITLNHVGLFSGPTMNLPFYLAYYSLTYT